jgi:chaperonin GroES
MKVFKPLGGRILVHQTEAQKQTASGIHLTPQSQEKPNEGWVIMGNDNIPSGSNVLFNRFAGVVTRLDGKEFLIMREEDLLGIIEEISDPTPDEVA